MNGFMKKVSRQYVSRLRLAVTVMTAVMLLMSLYMSSSNVSAAIPRVMVSDYSLSSDEIYAGDEFTLTLTLTNTYKYKVTNIKVTVLSDSGELLPMDSAGTAYISEIASEETATLTFKMKSDKNLDEKSYKLTVKTEYEDRYGYNSYEVSDYIYVPISLPSSLSVTGAYVADSDVRLGDNIEIIADVNNTGFTTLYKVSAVISGYNINETTAYIGTIEAGKSSTIDVITQAVALETNVNNTIVVTYEDKLGNASTVDCKINGNGVITVSEQDYTNVIEVKEDKTAALRANVKYYVVAAVVAFIIILLIIRRVRRKKKILEEFS